MLLIDLIAVVPTTILFFILLSEYFLIAIPRKKSVGNYKPPVSIIIPAHNEEKNIEECVESMCATSYKEKEIIFIENGSSDETLEKLKQLAKIYPIKVLSRKQPGKSEALNFGLSKALNEIVIVADADSSIHPEAIGEIVAPLRNKKIGGVAGVVRVKNRKHPLSWFQSIEYAYFSYFNSISAKINAIIFTPGVISAYRKKALEKVGMFPKGSVIEDFHIALKLHDIGYKIGLADKAISYTNVPTKFRQLFRQRMRWGRGVLSTLKEMKHMIFSRKNKAVGFYSLPLLSYWFLHASIMLPIILYWIFSGYFQWFVANSAGLSSAAAQYFFNWLSIFGIANLISEIAASNIALTYLLGVSIMITILSYVFYGYSVFKYDRRIGLREATAMMFFFPYILFISFIQISILVSAIAGRKIKW